MNDEIASLKRMNDAQSVLIDVKVKEIAELKEQVQDLSNKLIGAESRAKRYKEGCNETDAENLKLKLRMQSAANELETHNLPELSPYNFAQIDVDDLRKIIKNLRGKETKEAA